MKYSNGKVFDCRVLDSTLYVLYIYIYIYIYILVCHVCYVYTTYTVLLQNIKCGKFVMPSSHLIPVYTFVVHYSIRINVMAQFNDNSINLPCKNRRKV